MQVQLDCMSLGMSLNLSEPGLPPVWEHGQSVKFVPLHCESVESRSSSWPWLKLLLAAQRLSGHCCSWGNIWRAGVPPALELLIEVLGVMAAARGQVVPLCPLWTGIMDAKGAEQSELDCVPRFPPLHGEDPAAVHMAVLQGLEEGDVRG